MSRLLLLPERPHVGPMKPISSATATQKILPNGQFVLTIEHDVSSFFNTAVRRRVFSDEMGTAWLTHNVEEVSMFERILPGLYVAS